MNLKNKVNKRLFAIKIISGEVKEDQKITLENEEIGKIIIDGQFPFAIIKINKENKNSLINKELKTETSTIELNLPNWL